jgi:hypothetical protein
MAELNEPHYSAKVVLGELFGAKSKIETSFPGILLPHQAETGREAEHPYRSAA